MDLSTTTPSGTAARWCSATATASCSTGSRSRSTSSGTSSRTVKQHLLGQTADQADWLIGAGLFTERVRGKALRSMSAPGTAYDDPVLGKDPQPGTMSDYVQTPRDNGGVHINSGIPNRAFYLAATALGGHAWERAGKIWYETLRSAQVRPTTGFKRFAGVTVDVAGQLFGAGSTEQQAVTEAWTQVEVLP
jgi:Zn-dependent metalloprotease